MMIEHVRDHIFAAAFSLLPERMDSREARIMLLAIGLQGEPLQASRAGEGPTQGFWQFEKGGGVKGVLRHPASGTHAATACDALLYRSDAGTVYEAIADNDVLACVFARLLLWTLPDVLPSTADEGWPQYIDAWRPGKPHPQTWPDLYEQAVTLV